MIFFPRYFSSASCGTKILTEIPSYASLTDIR
jgi:hypothetical protein